MIATTHRPPGWQRALGAGSLVSRGLASATALAIAALVAAPPASAIGDPVANDDTYTTPKDTPLAVSAPGLLANDIPEDGVLSVATPPTNGALDLYSDGSFTYTPTAGFSGQDGFIYRLTATTSETGLLADIGSFTSRQSGDTTPIVAVGDQIFFPAFDNLHGRELWVTDGTTAGTTLVADLRAGAQSGLIQNPELVAFDGRVWFTHSPDGTAASARVWYSDGTAAGTVELPGQTGTRPFGLTAAAGHLWFAAELGSLMRLHRVDTDGSLTIYDSTFLGGMSIVVTGEMTPYSLGLAFVGATSATGTELFYADSTGVELLADVSTGSPGSSPAHLARANGHLYFVATADSGSTRDLYRVSTTPTTPVRVLTGGTHRGLLGTSFGLFHHDGSALRVIDAGGNAALLTPAGVTANDVGAVAGDRVAFRASDAAHGREVWVTDGTSTNTILLADVNTSGDSWPSILTTVGSEVHFSAEDMDGSTRPWVTDGTSAGTKIIALANPVSWADEPTFGGTEDLVVFWAEGGSEGYEPWTHRTGTVTDDAVVTITVTEPFTPLEVAHAETIDVQELIRVLAALDLPWGEQIDVHAVARVLLAHEELLGEHVTVNDVVAILLHIQAAHGESLTVTEVVSILLELAVAHGEELNVTDIVTIITGLFAGVGEQIDLTEVLTIVATAGVPLTAPVHVSTTTDIAVSGLFGPDGELLSEVYGGTSFQVVGSEFEPLTDVHIELRSTPIPLGSATADAFGIVAATVTIPLSLFDDGLTPGPHTVAIVQTEPPYEVTFPVTVIDPRPTVVTVGAPTPVQYSDSLQPVAVVFTDADSAVADLSASVTGLPAGVGVILSCSSTPVTCTATLGGVVTDPAGIYPGAVLISDGSTTTTVPMTIVVEAEDADIDLDPDNPVVEYVTSPGGDSGAFELVATVAEAVPDTGHLPGWGDLSPADVTAVLTPIGPGSPVDGSCTETGTGPVTVKCGFDDVPVGTYSVMFTVSGGYFVGQGEDLLTVADPSLGFATGGGWMPWPDSGERVNFGFTMKYNKKATSVQGQFLVIRHRLDGTIVRVKSNVVEALATGDLADGGWATFTGKATFMDSLSETEEGNHTFTVYAEDRDPIAADRFWVEIRDKDGVVVEAVSLAPPAIGEAVDLARGDITVPHTRKGWKDRVR